MQSVRHPESSLLIHTMRPMGWGFGDISAPLKIADLVVRRGIFRKENIAFTGFTRAFVPLVEKAGYTCIEVHQGYQKISMEEFVEKTHRFSLQIIFPDRTLQCVLANRVPALFLTEYNYKAYELFPPLTDFCVSQSLGLRTHSDDTPLGILINHDLVAFASLDESEKMELRPKLAQTLDEELQQLIFQGQSQEEFFEEQSLFVGYVHKGYSRLVQHALRTEGPLCLCLPGCKELPPDLEILEKGDGYILATHNDRQVRIVTMNASFEDMFTLWKISKNEVAATGDQSLTEAISAMKRIVYYERMQHKDGVARAWSSIQRQDPKAIIAENDCSERLIEVIEDLLMRSTDHILPLPESWDPAELETLLPLGQWRLVWNDLIEYLRIEQSGTSQVTGQQFETAYIGGLELEKTVYLIRHKES